MTSNEIILSPVEQRIIVTSPGPQGPPGISGSGASVEVVMVEDILEGQVVLADGTVGDSAAAGIIGRVVGVADSSVLAGFPVNVIVIGEKQKAGWAWTTGGAIYLNGTTLSQIAPTGPASIQHLGQALSSNKMAVHVAQGYRIV